MSLNLRPTTPDIKGRQRMRFNATLLSVSPNPLVNANGTQYRVCTIEYAHPKTGEIQQPVAFMFEGNFAHGVEPKKEYLCTITQMENNRGIINISHLPATGGDVDMSAFDFDMAEVSEHQSAFNAK